MAEQPPSAGQDDDLRMLQMLLGDPPSREAHIVGLESDVPAPAPPGNIPTEPGASLDSEPWVTYLDFTSAQDPRLRSTQRSSDSDPLGDASEAVQALSSKERKRESNRKAMQKYRQKKADKVTDLSREQDALRARLSVLESENRDLKLVQELDLHGASAAAEALEEDHPEFEPWLGWTDIDPDCTLILHLTADAADPPLRITSSQLRTWQPDQAMSLIHSYVHRVTPLLEAAQGNLQSPAGRQLQGFANEFNAAIAFAAMNNPRLVELCLNNVHPIEEREAACGRILEAAALTTAQQAQIMDMHVRLRRDVAHLKQERQRTLRALAELHQAEEFSQELNNFADMVTYTRKLGRIAESMYQVLCRFRSALWRQVLNAIQMATIISMSWPRSPCMWTIGQIVSEQVMKDEPAS